MNRKDCYMRKDSKMFGPFDTTTQERPFVGDFKSINKAKKESRKLMALGKKIVTKEA